MRIFRSTTSDQNANTYVGPFGEIVVGDNGTLLIQNNVTPGGTTISLEPATPTVLGGVKLGDGFVLNASNQVTTSILYSTNLTQPTQHYRLELDTNGVVILPDQSIINGSTLRAVAGSYAGLTTNDGENSWMWVDSNGAYIATDYNATANQWTFDNEGALIFPGNTLVVGAGNVVNFIGSTDTPLVTFSTGPDSFSQFGWQNSSVSPSNISGIQTDATGVRIGTGAPDGGGPIYQGNIGWTFGADGITTFPNNILQAPDGSTLEIKTTSGNVYSILNAYNTFTNIGIEDDTTGPNPAWAYLETAMSNVNTPKATVVVRAADTGIGMRWTFSADGNLTIPSNGTIATLSGNFGVNTQLYPTFTAPNQTEDGGPVISVLISQFADSIYVDSTWSASIASNIYAIVSSVTNGSYQEITLDSGSFAYDAQATFTPPVATWSFDEYGTTIFPGGTIANGNLEGTGNFGFEMPADTGFTILSNVGVHQWTFDAAGGLTFPDNTVQTTAYTGGASTGYALTVGDINTDATHFDVVTVDNAGNTYYLGHTTGLTPGDSPFIVKVDGTGSVLWQTTLEWGGVVTAAFVYQTLLGLTFSDADNPSQCWSVSLNASDGQVTYSYYFVVTTETIKIRDMVLGVIGGNPAWESTVGYFNSGTGENSALINVFSMGPGFTYSIAEDGEAGAVEYYGTTTVPITANVYAVGSSVTYGSVVSSYTLVGDVQWHKNINLTQPLTITATSVAYSNGYIYVVSNNTSNGDDGFITKLDAITGTIIWQNGMGYDVSGGFEPFGISDGCIAIDGNGDIITAWNYGSAYSQGNDILVVKFDTNGNTLWQRSIGTAGGDYHNAGDATEFLTADNDHFYIAMSANDNVGIGSLGGALQLPLDGSGLGSYGNWLYSQQSWTVYPQDITGGSVDITANLIATTITLTNSVDQGVTVTNSTLPTTLNLIGGGITTGDITFDATTLIGPAGSVDGYKIRIRPSETFTNTVAFYPTADNDIHIFEDSELGGGITLGDYGKSTISVWGNGGTSTTVDNIELSAINNGNITLKTDATTTPHQWILSTDGTTTFPTLNVDLHNGGVQSGSVLQFGDASQQAIITGPTPLVPGNNAQRLIIQGQNGGTGEGGDVYFWAGDADTNGGDIKIYAGDADNVTTGNGGYINIDAGNGYDYGGDVTLSAGYSTLNGGDITLTAGYAFSGAHGIIQLITAGNHNWSFGSTGNLTLPVGGTINFSDGSNALVGGGAANTGNVTFSDINIIGTGNLHLQPDLNNAGAYLDIYLTVGPDIHIAGNGETVILGRDSGANVKVGVDGNVSIQADSGTAYAWTFGNDGNIVLPETASILSDNVMTLQSGDTLFLRSNLGGVGIYSGNSQLSTTSDLGIEAYADSINFTPNAEGDVLIDINNANTFVEISGPAGSWIFAGDGNLTLPAGGQIVSAANTGNVVINASDGVQRTWTFEGSGNLTLPTSGTISYAPSTPSDWASPAPTSIEAALDRLAAVVKVLNGGIGA